VDGLTDGWGEAVRSTGSGRGLITVLWVRESSRGWGDSFLFLVSSGRGADTLVPEFVIPSLCAARVPFEADMLDDLKGGMLSAETFWVLYASRGGCNG
jgi:hypothetical protein